MGKSNESKEEGRTLIQKYNEIDLYDFHPDYSALTDEYQFVKVEVEEESPWEIIAGICRDLEKCSGSDPIYLLYSRANCRYIVFREGHGQENGIRECLSGYKWTCLDKNDVARMGKGLILRLIYLIAQDFSFGVVDSVYSICHVTLKSVVTQSGRIYFNEDNSRAWLTIKTQSFTDINEFPREVKETKPAEENAAKDKQDEEDEEDEEIQVEGFLLPAIEENKEKEAEDKEEKETGQDQGKEEDNNNRKKVDKSRKAVSEYEERVKEFYVIDEGRMRRVYDMAAFAPGERLYTNKKPRAWKKHKNTVIAYSAMEIETEEAFRKQRLLFLMSQIDLLRKSPYIKDMPLVSGSVMRRENKEKYAETLLALLERIISVPLSVMIGDSVRNAEQVKESLPDAMTKAEEDINKRIDDLCRRLHRERRAGRKLTWNIAETPGQYTLYVIGDGTHISKARQKKHDYAESDIDRMIFTTGGGRIIQHIAEENIKDKVSLENCIKELLVKEDCIRQRISLIKTDGAKYTFYVPCLRPKKKVKGEKRKLELVGAKAMRIDPDCSLSFFETVMSDEDIVLDTMCESNDLARWEYSVIREDDSGKTGILHVIKDVMRRPVPDTDIILPDLEAVLQDKANSIAPDVLYRLAAESLDEAFALIGVEKENTAESRERFLLGDIKKDELKQELEEIYRFLPAKQANDAVHTEMSFASVLSAIRSTGDEVLPAMIPMQRGKFKGILERKIYDLTGHGLTVALKGKEKVDAYFPVYSPLAYTKGKESGYIYPKPDEKPLETPKLYANMIVPRKYMAEGEDILEPIIDMMIEPVTKYLLLPSVPYPVKLIKEYDQLAEGML